VPRQGSSMYVQGSGCHGSVQECMCKALGAMAGFKKVWTSKETSLKIKLNILRTCIFSILLYTSESWTPKKRDRDKLKTFEMRCYRRIMHIRWQQIITNEEIGEEWNASETSSRCWWRERWTYLDTSACRMNNSRVIQQLVFGMVDAREPEEDSADNGSTISRSGVRWTCIQQTSWHNQESNGGSLWNECRYQRTLSPCRDRWSD